MAEGLGIRVLCEGVETKEQVELLKQLGCCYVQGYYYAKPMPMEEFITTYCKSIPDGKNIMMICMKQKLCNGKKNS